MGDDFFAGAGLAGDEDVGIRGADRFDEIEHGLHAGRVRDHEGQAFGAEEAVFGFEALPAAEGVAEFDLSFDDGIEAGVVPGFLEEVARTTADGFDGEIDGSPGGHHDDGERGVEGLDLGEQVEAFLAGSSVAGVVEIHDEKVEILGSEGVEDGGWGSCLFGLIALALEKQTEGFEDVDLVVCDQDARFHIRWFMRAGETPSGKLLRRLGL